MCYSNHSIAKILVSFFLFQTITTYLHAQTAIGTTATTVVENGSFEVPNLATNVFQYAPSGSGWTFFSTAGISDVGTSFTGCGPNTTDGNQVLFLQQNGSANRTTYIPTAGIYRVSFKAAQRACYNTIGQTVRVQIDGANVCEIRPANTSYQVYTSLVYWLTAGNHNLKLEGIITAGDNTVLIDDVRWESIPRWSQATTWQGGVLPSAISMTTIPAGRIVAMDLTTCASQMVHISGVLAAPLNVNFNLAAEFIHVNSGGLLEIGQNGASYTANGKITLVGSNPNSTIGGADMGAKGIGVMSGGRLELHGNYKTSWTQLNATADVDASTITLKEVPQNWKFGDRIVIASTDFDMTKAEERTIKAINGNQITLNGELENKHFGVLQNYSSTSGSWNVDERAEVGMLSRNLVIEGDAASENLAFGGHIMVMQGGVSHIENTELNRMGQRFKLGRYPFHWHLVGNASGQYFNNNSVHHTYNRAITIHSTNNTIVNGNVCYYNLGHAFFLEDGNETGNVISNNLGLVTRRPEAQYVLLKSDLTEGRNASGPSTFWITHPSNTVQNNRAAGSAGSGFWFAFHQNINSAAVQPGLNPNIMNINAGAFDNNTAHSSYHGWLVGMAPNYADATQTPNLDNDYMPTQAPTFSGIAVFKNRLGVYSRIGGNNIASTYIGLQVADNWEGESNTWVSDIRQSLWVGASQNYEPIPSGVSPSYSSENTVVGHVLYDGPCRIYNSHFAGFDRPNFSLFDQWGANLKYHGHSLSNTTLAAGSYQVHFRRSAGPVWFNASITDIDGKFTGTPNTAIVARVPILIDNTARTIKSDALNGVEINKRYCYLEVRTSDEVYTPAPGQEYNRRQTSQLLRSDGVMFTEHIKELEGVSLSLILNGEYQYKYSFYKTLPNISRFDFHSMNANDWVIVEIPNVPVTAKVYTAVPTSWYSWNSPLVALPLVSTLAALKTYNRSAAAYIGNSMYLRYQAPPGSDFRNTGINGSLFLCLNGNCAAGNSYVLPDSDGDGASNVVETSPDLFFKRKDTEVNDLSFDFNYGDITEWYTLNVEAYGYVNNTWAVRASNGDPQVMRKGLYIDGDKIKYIDIRTVSETAGNYQLFWSTADEDHFTEAKSVLVNYPTVWEWRVLRFQVGDHPMWKGKRITGLRIDPVGGASKNANFDWIKAKNTWIYDLNHQVGNPRMTLQLFDGGGNNAKFVTPAENTLLQVVDNTWSFHLTDWNNDGYMDIAGFKKQLTASGYTEINVLNGKTNFQSFLYQSQTILGPLSFLNDHICFADYNGDKKPEIWLIGHNSTATNMTELHLIDGNNLQSFMLQIPTGLGLAPNTIDDFCVYDYDGDKLVDLWYIKKQCPTNKTEVHILKNTNDANKFKYFAANIATVLPITNANWSFDVADYNKDGIADLIGIDRIGVGGKIAVHVLDGATSFQTFLLQQITDMPSGTASHTYRVDGGTPATGIGYLGARVPSTTTDSYHEITEVKDVVMYPNPTQNQVSISLGDYAGKPLNLTIVPISGGPVCLRKNYKTTDFQLSLSLENLNAGIYIVQLNFPGMGVVQKKLVITK